MRPDDRTVPAVPGVLTRAPRRRTHLRADLPGKGEAPQIQGRPRRPRVCRRRGNAAFYRLFAERNRQDAAGLRTDTRLG